MLSLCGERVGGAHPHSSCILTHPPPAALLVPRGHVLTGDGAMKLESLQIKDLHLSVRAQPTKVEGPYRLWAGRSTPSNRG